ncbi:NAD(+) diphosphatase [Clostridium akagii]|uniref:NAD(+) diphosphatase n=1 Tax=Clostridium akagii TaxID=91623 RepID=UPI000689C330|nr:NAD(+) diphosphatase [Clostridium akagii]
MKSAESIYKRYIPATVCEQEGISNTYWFVFSSNKLLVNIQKDGVSIPFVKTIEELNIVPLGTQQYLGTLEGQPSYALEVSEESADQDGMCFTDLRSLYGQLEEDIFILAGKALQIVNWDKNHKYCGGCGTETVTIQGERAKRCPKCGLINYTQICPAVITAVLKGNKILMAHNSSFTENMYSLIAGFLEPGETLEECVQREIMEEVGIKVKNIKYFGSQPWPFPNSMMIGYVAEYDSGEILVDGVEITEAGWYDAENLPELPTKISIARKIIDWYIHDYSQKNITEHIDNNSEKL